MGSPSAALESIPPIRDESRVRELLARIAEVCPIPANAQRVMALASDVASPIDDLVNAVASDPALTAEVIRVANSPAYGMSGRIADLRQAVVMLGLSEIRNVAAALVMLSSFAGDGPEATAMHSQCVLGGTIGGLIAPHAPNVNASTAWLAGTLSEIGALACLAVDPEGFSRIYGACGLDFDQRDRRETAAYGAPSSEFGARLLQRNGLPTSVVSAVRGELEDGSDGTRVAWMSRRLAPVLVQAQFSGGTDVLDGCLEELRQRSGLAVDAATLRTLCLNAAELTERGLRGDASLLPPPNPSDSPAVCNDNGQGEGDGDGIQVADQQGRRKKFKKRRWRLW